MAEEFVLQFRTEEAAERAAAAFARLLGEGGPGTPTPYSRLAPGDSVEL